ncbi:MAG: hypothetical protein BZY82_10135 [SAR202 cluster bacterium Io17-Chloro-G3]|nr:MAG: hypothetical protein BZY82_10135 [SAR202 cluster bacterium Io17-Chloro-G3]
MVDLITTEVINSKFQSLLIEMRYVLIRSAYSSLMRESRDCGFGFTTAEGEVPFQGASNWLFMYGDAARKIKENVALKDLRDNDVFIGNDPHEIGAPHTPDVLVMSPVLFEGELIGFSSSVAHKMDFGGAVAGSIYSGATEVFQEGLRLPVMKFYDEGVVISQVEEVIRGNVRNADLVLGDLRAQVGATLTGARRFKELAIRYGKETLMDALQEMLAAPEKRISSHVSQWPGEIAEAEAFLDPPPNHDGPVRIHLRVTRTGGHLTFDFSESDLQVRSPVNVPRAAILRQCISAVIGLTDPDIQENAGGARAMSLVTKQGTVASPVPPAPVGNTTMVQPAYNDVIISALSALKGEGGVAERGGHGTTAFGWRKGLVEGRKYVQYEIHHSCTGATVRSDGISAVNPISYMYRNSGRLNDNPTIQETPIEVLEAQFPVRVRRYEFIPDSGGAGKFRGGVAPRRTYEALETADLNVRHSLSFVIPSEGVDEGQSGRKGRVVLNIDKPEEKVLDGWSVELSSGDTLTLESGGGGGVGDPISRSPVAVLRDVAEGFVSVQGAMADYRVVINEMNGTFVLDSEATAKARSK